MANSSRLRRRRFVEATATGAALALAGCMSGPSSASARMKYDGEWSGAVESAGSTRSVNGTGTETFEFDVVPTVASVTAQKKDGGDGTLTVQILGDGEVLKESSTSDPYGVASVSHSF